MGRRKHPIRNCSRCPKRYILLDDQKNVGSNPHSSFRGTGRSAIFGESVIKGGVFMQPGHRIDHPVPDPVPLHLGDEFVLQTSTSTKTLHLEDLSVGDRWTSPSREVTADDVADFAELTGDHDPLHKPFSEIDQEDSTPNPFGEPIAHGLLGLSILAGQSTTHPRVRTLALTSIQDWKFLSPIFFGDQVHVATTVVEIEPHGRRAGRVTWLRELVNQDGRVVQSGHFVSLVASKSRRPREDKPAVAETVETPSIRRSLPAR